MRCYRSDNAVDYKKNSVIQNTCIHVNHVNFVFMRLHLSTILFVVICYVRRDRINSYKWILWANT